MSNIPLPFKISALVIVHDEHDRLLMIKRNKSPNIGCWSPIGGKLEMAIGESPFECAVREIEEETQLRVSHEELHLWGYVSEKHFEGDIHWLMFMFDCKRRITKLPRDIDEGRFAFYKHSELETIQTPPGDKRLIWDHYQSHKNGFIAIRADCHPSRKLDIVVEQSMIQWHSLRLAC